MKTALILHGKPDKEEYYDKKLPSESNSHWLPWLQKQLLLRDILAQTLEMPRPYEPDYDLWRKEFERYDITFGTILVGHSCGAGFIVRWLSEHPEVTVGKVVLVAPSLGLDWENRNFFAFTIDPDLASRTAGVTIFGSDNDKPATHEAIQRYRAVIANAQYREFKGYGHFCYEDMRTVEFPELLEEVLA